MKVIPFYPLQKFFKISLNLLFEFLKLKLVFLYKKNCSF